MKNSIDKLDALQHYEETKAINAELQRKVRQLQHQHNKLQEELDEYMRLKTQFAGNELTLDEVQQHIRTQTRTIYREEIEQRAQHRFDAEASTLTITELNRQLHLPREQRLPPLNKLLDTEIDKRVNEQLNDVFWSNVRAGVIQAKEKEWKPYLDKYFREKITPYCRTVSLEQFLPHLINQPINVTCPKCNNVSTYQLTREGISNLLTYKVAVFECATPNCIEGILNRHPTHIPFSLGEAVSILVGEPVMPQSGSERTYTFKLEQS